MPTLRAVISHWIHDFLSNYRQFLISDHINNATDGQGSKNAQVICRRMQASAYYDKKHHELTQGFFLDFYREEH